MANKRFATSLFAACLATTCLGYGAFASDPSLYFYPTQKWAVSQTGGDAASPNCTLSNTFNNGFGINIGGNASGLSMLEIDFRQPSFETGKRYEVVYTVPGQSREIFQARARTGSVLTSDISSREGFPAALESAATMDLSIQNNEFRLYLTGFAKAMEEYRDCLSPPPPAVAEAPIFTDSSFEKDRFDAAAAFSPDEADLSAPPSALADGQTKKKEMESIVAQATSLADRYEASLDPADELPVPMAEESGTGQSGEKFFFGSDSESQTAEVEAGGQPTKPRERERYTETLNKQLSERSKEYKPAPSANPAQDLDSSDKILFDSPKSEQKDAKESSAYPGDEAAPPAEPTRKSVTIPAYKMTRNMASMEADLTQVGLPPEATEPAAGDETSETDIDRIAMASAALEPSSGVAGEDFIQMRDKIRNLEMEVNRLSNENQTLDNELKSTLKDAEQERLSVSSDNWNLERATMRYNEAERQLKRLGRQLQAARQQCTLEKQALETMLFDPQVTEQQQLAKLSTLEEQLAEAKVELQNVQRRYEERIRILQGQMGTP